MIPYKCHCIHKIHTKYRLIKQIQIYSLNDFYDIYLNKNKRKMKMKKKKEKYPNKETNRKM